MRTSCSRRLPQAARRVFVAPRHAVARLTSLAHVLRSALTLQVKLRDVFKGKKGILIAVPGAFTPGCSKSHLPSYVADYDKLKAKGCQVVVCTATNDPYVMYAWGKDQGAEGKVLMLSDKDAELAKALGVTKEGGAILRSARYSAVVEDNKFKSFNLADAGGGMECTLAASAADQL